MKQEMTPPLSLPEELDDIAYSLNELYGQNARRILREIRILPGPSRLTLMIEDDGLGFEMEENGEFSKGENAEEAFLGLLKVALHEGGALMFRQMLSTFEEGDARSGHPGLYQQNRVFGLRFMGGDIHPLDLEEMRWSHETDAKTGLPIPKEPGIIYGEWNVLTQSDALKRSFLGLSE